MKSAGAIVSKKLVRRRAAGGDHQGRSASLCREGLSTPRRPANWPWPPACPRRCCSSTFPNKEALYSAMQLACCNEKDSDQIERLKALEPSASTLALLVHMFVSKMLAARGAGR